MYPDYGSPGAPNPDPYYLSPSEVAHIEAQHAERIADFRADVAGFIRDTRGDMDLRDVLAVLAEITASVRAEVMVVNRHRAACPFRNAEEAWFWTVAALAARRAGVSYSAQLCEPDDVVKCLDDLYRRRRIDLAHARILRIWGERQIAPDRGSPSERSDWCLWREAIGRLELSLRQKRIVG